MVGTWIRDGGTRGVDMASGSALSPHPLGYGNSESLALIIGYRYNLEAM